MPLDSIPEDHYAAARFRQMFTQTTPRARSPPSASSSASRHASTDLHSTRDIAFLRTTEPQNTDLSRKARASTALRGAGISCTACGALLDISPRADQEREQSIAEERFPAEERSGVDDAEERSRGAERSGTEERAGAQGRSPPHPFSSLPPLPTAPPPW